MISKLRLSSLGLLVLALPLQAADFTFTKGNALHTNWDADGLWTDGNGVPYGPGVHPGAGDTILSMNYDTVVGAGIPNIYLNGDRTVARLESADGEGYTTSTRILNGSTSSGATHDTLTITESLHVRAGSYFLRSQSGGQFSINAHQIRIGDATNYPAVNAKLELASNTAGHGNIRITARETLLNGRNSSFLINNSFDSVNGYIHLGHVQIALNSGSGWGGITINNNAEVHVSSLRSSTFNNAGKIGGTGTLIITPGTDAPALSVPANFSRVIEGAIAVEMAGDLLQTFAVANSYTGGTSITQGVLAVANSSGSGLGTGAVTLSGSGKLAGDGIVALGSGSGVTVGAGGEIAPGEDNRRLVDGGHETLSYRTLRFNDTAVTMETDAAFRFRLGADGSSDSIAFSSYTVGDLTLAADGSLVHFDGAINTSEAYVLFSFANGDPTLSGLTEGLLAGSGTTGYTATFHYDHAVYGGPGTIAVTFEAIPEPSTALLALTGIGLTALVGRRRLRK